MREGVRERERDSPHVNLPIIVHDKAPILLSHVIQKPL